jgi:hypothetical protein
VVCGNHLYTFPFQSDVVRFVRNEVVQGWRKTTFEDIELAQLAFAFPTDVGSYMYDIERSCDRAQVGKIVAYRGTHNDPLLAYLCVALANGDCFEAYTKREEQCSLHLINNGTLFGNCRTDAKDVLRGSNFLQLFLWNEYWGSIRPGRIVSRNSLHIDRREGEVLPIILSRKDSIIDFVVAVGRLVSLAFLWSPPPANLDLVIPSEVALMKLTEDEQRLYFILTICLRAMIYRMEFGTGAG